MKKHLQKFDLQTCLSIKWLLVLLFACFLPSFAVKAQIFQEQLLLNNPAAGYASSAWADIDNDGDLDLALMGANPSFFGVLENQGGSFVYIALTSSNPGQSLSPASTATHTQFAWGDWNNDNLMDLAAVGMDSLGDFYTKIWENQGNNTFVNNFDLLPGAFTSIEWLDYDNDGDQDLITIGKEDQTGKSVLYTNDWNIGQWSFTYDRDSLQGYAVGTTAVGDYDNDGDQDFVVSGLQNYPGFQPETVVYKNDGSGNFSIDATIQVPGIIDGSIDFADFDMDGDLDLLLVGAADTNYNTTITQVHLNTPGGSNRYSTIVTFPKAFTNAKAAIADYNLDGFMDVLITGRDTTPFLEYQSNLYPYNPSTGFTLDAVNSPSIHSSSLAAADFMDFDGDGDMDVFVCGEDSFIGSGSVSAFIYKNIGSTMNAAPGVPTGLTAIAGNDNTITFSWTAPSDDHTATAGLSYHLMVGTLTDAMAKASPLADTTDGHRSVLQTGSILGTSATIGDLAVGITYCGRVSAIDGGLAGSPFSSAACATAVVLAIDENAQLFSLSAGPIPATDVLKIHLSRETPRANVQVISMEGRILMDIQNVAAQDYQLDVNALASGMYLLRVTDTKGQNAATLRFLKN